MISLWWFYLLMNAAIALFFWVAINKLADRVSSWLSRTDSGNLILEWLKDVSSNISYIARYLGLFPGIFLFSKVYLSESGHLFLIRIEAILLLTLLVVCVNNFLDKFEIYRIRIVKSNSKLNKRELTFQLTLIPLAISGFKYSVYAIAVLTGLTIFRLNIVPIINAAGIGMVVISFFFKSVFEDIIASAFIFIEGKFFYGSYLKIGSFKGRVIKITWSSTYLEENGKITVISNRTINNIVIICDEEVPKKDG